MATVLPARQRNFGGLNAAIAAFAARKQEEKDARDAIEGRKLMFQAQMELETDPARRAQYQKILELFERFYPTKGKPSFIGSMMGPRQDIQPQRPQNFMEQSPNLAPMLQPIMNDQWSQREWPDVPGVTY